MSDDFRILKFSLDESKHKEGVEGRLKYSIEEIFNAEVSFAAMLKQAKDGAPFVDDEMLLDYCEQILENVNTVSKFARDQQNNLMNIVELVAVTTAAIEYRRTRPDPGSFEAQAADLASQEKVEH